MRAPHLRECLQETIAASADRAQRLAGAALVFGERQQQMLGRDVLVREVFRLFLRIAQRRCQFTGGLARFDVRALAEAGEVLEGAVGLRAQGGD